MRVIFSVVILCLFQNISFAQFWQIVDKQEVENKGLKEIIPTTFVLYNLADEDMKSILWTAPLERDVDVRNSNVIINVGLPTGKIETFKIVEYSMMEAGLAIRYPDFKTFYGVSTVNPLTSIRIDYTLHGFRAVIRSEQGKIFIDHYQRNDKNTRIVYYKKDYPNVSNWACEVDTDMGRLDDNETGLRTGDCQLRSYRLAQAANGEYSNYHGATSSSQSGLVLTAVINVINRINEVYELDVAVRLILVENTDDIFYYNASTDPYTNGNGGTMLGENQTTCDNVIGTTNYDIGHVFSTGGGGVAYLQSVCNASIKAGGVTGQTAPIGDPFSIDYVAHEMGHQFGGNHTQNNNCNRNSATAMEPGSASTIMGYAGICNPNVQSNSDAYFHAVNLQEMKAFLLANGGNCDQIVSTFSNSAPVITSLPNYSIPKSTPFVLTLTATDPNGDPMLYCWDQMNNNVATMPPLATNTVGPMFRSVTPTSNPTKYFPNINNIINNTSNTWEVLPSVGRSMLFRGVVRDFTGVAGCNSEINVTVTTRSGAGPFVVTSYNTASTWNEGDTKTITWNEAGTTANQVNCANVDIFLSYDGGLTYPVTLATNVPNINGTADIVVPSGLTTMGRVMVRGSGNIFFDINDANITIAQSQITYSLTTTPNTFETCVGDDITTTVNVVSMGGYATPVSLSATGLPAGAIATFGTNPVTPGSTTSLVISNIMTSGIYNVTVNGVSGSINKTSSIALDINSSPTVPVLSSPANLATNVPILAQLSWAPSANASSYDIEVAYDLLFTDVLLSANITSTLYNFTTALYGGTTFYWRVRSNGDCPSLGWSTVRTFETEYCWLYNSIDVPLVIPAVIGSVTSDLYIADRGILTDVDVIDLTGIHPAVNLLQFTLTNPSSSSVLFWDQPCTKTDMDFDIKFNDEATTTWPCPPVDGLTYIPSNALSALDTDQQEGLWTLDVDNFQDAYSGSLDSWGIKTCVTDFCRLTVDHTRASGPGSLKAAIDCAIDGDTIRFASYIVNDTIHLGLLDLLVDKGIFIESTSSANIHVMSSSNNATLQNNAPLSDQILKIKGLHIHSSNAGIGAIKNLGNLVLEDVTLHKWNGSSTATIQNEAGATTLLIGNCKVVTD